MLEIGGPTQSFYNLYEDSKQGQLNLDNVVRNHTDGIFEEGSNTQGERQELRPRCEVDMTCSFPYFLKGKRYGDVYLRDGADLHGEFVGLLLWYCW